MKNMCTSSQYPQQWLAHLKLTINGFSVKFLLDSGAGVNIIDSHTYEKMESLKLNPTTKKIYAYKSSQPLPVKGTFQAKIESPLTGQS